MFKVILIIIVLIAAFMFVMIKSGAWQSQLEWTNKGGMNIYQPVPRIDWDKFFGYLKDIPNNIFSAANKIMPRKQEQKKSRIEVEVGGKRLDFNPQTAK